MTNLLIVLGGPGFIRAEDGPEFVAVTVRDWPNDVRTRMAFIEPKSPWENGYRESFDGKPREDFHDGAIFHSLHEVKILIQQSRHHYDTMQPHSPAGYWSVAPEVITSMDRTPTMD